jgi:hypothetical protein
MHGVGGAIVEYVDPRVGGHRFPVGRDRLVAVARGLLLDELGLRVAEHRQARLDPGRRINVGDLLVRIGMTPAHKAASEQSDTDFSGDVRRRIACRHGMIPPKTGLFWPLPWRCGTR